MSSKYGLQRHTDSSLKSRQIEERQGVHYLLAQRASEKQEKEEPGPTRYPWIGLLWKYSACSHLIPYPPSPAVHGIMVNRHSPARRSSTMKVSASPSLSRGKYDYTGYSFAPFYLLSVSSSCNICVCCVSLCVRACLVPLRKACSACEKVQGSSWHALPDMIVILDLFADLAFHLGRFGLQLFIYFWLSWRTGEHNWRHLPQCRSDCLTYTDGKSRVTCPYGLRGSLWPTTWSVDRACLVQER
jgi:hypothetical protein